MSTAIVEFIAGDRGPELTNSGGARTMLIGSTWNVIRVGVLMTIADFGSNPTGAPRFYLGVLNGVVAANHVLKSTTTNFFGVYINEATWTRNAGPPVYYSLLNIPVAKKVGATLTTGTDLTATGTISGTTANRNVLLIQITKGSPNWTMELVYPAVAGAQSDRTLAQFKAALEASTVALAASGLVNYTASSAIGQAFTEAPAPNAVHFAWDKSSFTAKISAIGYAKIS
jgi:hypothetical protein